MDPTLAHQEIPSTESGSPVATFEQLFDVSDETVLAVLPPIFKEVASELSKTYRVSLKPIVASILAISANAVGGVVQIPHMAS